MHYYSFHVNGSSSVSFAIDAPTEPLPTTWVIAAIAAAATGGTALTVYSFAKTRAKPKNTRGEPTTH